MTALFSLVVFLSAALLFAVQPMVAKVLLPRLGGSPAVWNTCMVFFQATLLGGYLYAHLLVKLPRRGAQVALHGALLSAPLLLLPLAITGADPPVGSPVGWLLAALVASVGPPLILLSTTGPLMQGWFATTGRDPYWLYAASNAGSLVGLLGYPIAVEPWLTLTRQREVWSGGYLAFAVLAVGAGLWSLRRSNPPAPASAPVRSAGANIVPTEAPPTPRRMLLWLALAMVPAALVLGVTQHITTDLAAAPFLWVGPLALYLITFILAFHRRPGPLVASASRLLPIVVVAVALTMIISPRGSRWALIYVVTHLVGLFIAALMCHARLAELRPRPRFLTSFYLVIAAGGVLGGAMVALVAPLVFNFIGEYPLALLAACALRPTGAPAPATKEEPWWRPLVRSRSPVNVSLCAVIAAVLLATGLITAGTNDGELLAARRTFFGVYRVFIDYTGTWRRLKHGTTTHGAEHTGEHAGLPTLYYYPLGPIGNVFEARDTDPQLDDIGIIGLGTGTVAAYGKPGQRFTFFEIDPAVEAIARNTSYFTYLRDCRAELRVVLGDARVTLAREPDGRFDLLVVDAFSSDAIPIHLATLEAIEMYMSKLNERGLLAFHISNRYLDLAPVLGAAAARLGLVAAFCDDSRVEGDDERKKRQDEDRQRGWSASTWVLLARSVDALGPLAHDKRWMLFKAPVGAPLWTDDYSNIVSVLRWR
jgi:hypothetical protein